LPSCLTTALARRMARRRRARGVRLMRAVRAVDATGTTRRMRLMRMIRHTRAAFRRPAEPDDAQLRVDTGAHGAAAIEADGMLPQARIHETLHSRAGARRIWLFGP